MQHRNTLLIVFALCAAGCSSDAQYLTGELLERYNTCKSTNGDKPHAVGEFDFKTGLCSCGGITCEKAGMACDKNGSCFVPDCILEGGTRCIDSEKLGAVQETCRNGMWSATAKCKSESCNPQTNKCEGGTNDGPFKCNGEGPVCINGNSYNCAAKGEDPKPKEKCENGCDNDNGKCKAKPNTPCQENATRCEDNQLQICKDGSFEAKDPPCENGCENGKCKAKPNTPCQENTTRCEGRQLQICKDGSFQNDKTCENGCENGKCKCPEECSEKCDENGKCLCGDNDKYYCKEGIVYDCSDASEKGARFCTNGVLYSCDSSGKLISDNCNPYKYCADNACAECENGELKCDGKAESSGRSKLKQCIHGKYRDVSCYYKSGTSTNSFDLCSKVPATDVNLGCTIDFEGVADETNPAKYYKKFQGCKLITLSNAEEHRYQLVPGNDHYDVTYYGKADESSSDESGKQCRCNKGATKCQVSTYSDGKSSCKLITCNGYGKWESAKNDVSCIQSSKETTCGKCLNATYSHKEDSMRAIYAVCYKGKNYDIKCPLVGLGSSQICTIKSGGEIFEHNTKYEFCNGNNKIYFEVPDAISIDHGVDDHGVDNVELTNCQAGLQKPAGCDFDCKNINNEGTTPLLPKE